MVVVVGGPDGTGKSTLAEILPGLCQGRSVVDAPPLADRRAAPGRGAGRGPEGDPPTLALALHTAPRVGGPPSPITGFDFLLGGWLGSRRSGPAAASWWWSEGGRGHRGRSAEVSAGRAREQLVRALGRLLPKPDLVIVLETSPEVALARKAEIETRPRSPVRQRTRGGPCSPTGYRRTYVDAIAPGRQEVAAAAREAVFTTLVRGPPADSGRAGWRFRRGVAAVAAPARAPAERR